MEAIATAKALIPLLSLLSLPLYPGCAHRYSEDPSDWVGPRNADFESDFSVCRERMDEAPFRYGGDPRLLLLDCMSDLGWHLGERSPLSKRIDR